MLRFLRSQLFVKPQLPNCDFSGQTVIVTGGNSGLGLEAAKHLVRLKAERVIITVRSAAKGQTAVDEIEASCGIEGRAEYRILDMSSYDSVKQFVDELPPNIPVHGLLLNAGIATLEFEVAEGNEKTITVNVVSSFLLALLLLPRLRISAKASQRVSKIAVVTSDTHEFTTIKAERRSAARIFDGLNNQGSTNMGERYFVSKLLEILTVRALGPRLTQLPVDEHVSICAVNPGMTQSSLTADVTGFTGWKFRTMEKLLARSTEVGARTYVHALCCGMEANGKYLSDGQINEDQLSRFVTSAEGRNTQERFYGELMKKLEDIDKRVLNGLDFEPILALDPA